MRQGAGVIVLVVVCALSAAAADSDEYDYCQLNTQCGGSSHTMCSFPQQTPGAECHGTLNEDRWLSERDKEHILNLHNELRGRLTEGLVEHQPTAARLNMLEWDQELETIARRWAMQCNSTLQTCRLTKKGEPFGENLSSLGVVTLSGDVDVQIQAWFDEHKDLPPDVVKSYRDTGSPTEHYTQIVWAATERLGCDRAVYNATGLTGYLVCLYRPAGNVIGQHVYPTVEEEEEQRRSQEQVDPIDPREPQGGPLIDQRGSWSRKLGDATTYNSDGETTTYNSDGETTTYNNDGETNRVAIMSVENAETTTRAEDGETTTGQYDVTGLEGSGNEANDAADMTTGNGTDGVVSVKGSLSEAGREMKNASTNEMGHKPGGRASGGYVPGKYLSRGGGRGAVGQLQPTCLSTAVVCLLVVNQIYD